jgi:hypothetical protein
MTPPQMILRPHLPFRGDRNYLQSATLFDDMLAWGGGNPRNIDLVFHRKTERQVGYDTSPPADDALLVATWRDADKAIFVVESDQPITQRVAYDEQSLSTGSSSVPTASWCPPTSAISPVMEAIVAAFKALLHRTVVPHKPKLVFVRVRLQSVPQLPLEVRFSRRIGEFYQGDIRADGRAVGQIFFGEWR